MARTKKGFEYIKDKAGKLFIKANSIAFDDNVSLEDKIQWKEVGYTAGGAKYINVADCSKWNECLITLGVNGMDNTNRRALNTTLIPRDLFAIGYEDFSEGRHLLLYNGVYGGGLSFVSNTQLHVYAWGNSLVRVYYR